MALTTNNVALAQCLINELGFPTYQTAKFLGITKQAANYYSRETYLGTTWKFRPEYQKIATRRAANLVLFRNFIFDERSIYASTGNF